MADRLHIVCPDCSTTNRIPVDRLNDAPKCGRCSQALFTGQPVELDANSFERHVSRNDIPLLVDFWASWCGPCKMMAPAYEQAAKQLEPGIRVAKLDTERSQTIAARYGVRSIPTLILFRSGKEVARQAGAMRTPEIVRWTSSQL